MARKPIYVTQPFLPPLSDFIPYLEKIWDAKTLTNGGPMHQQLEAALCDFLGVEYISLFSNGTLALVTALQALRITGEAITTPYSFVATAHALQWNGIKPVFADVDPESLNLDPKRLESLITPLTTAIVPVHCYGNPCDVFEIQAIADRYNLRVVYDAAHAFGVNDGQGSILRHGDLSILSFHATKVFNTFEGGAIISPDAKTKERIDNLKNFGFAGETTVVAPGINGKMSEVNAAFGLLQLKHVDEIIKRRQDIHQRYTKALKSVPGIRIVPRTAEGRDNYAYCPILIEEDYGVSRDTVYESLKQRGIYGRRYFYPLISAFPMYRGLPSAIPHSLPIASNASERVICLPIYPALADSDIDHVVEVLASLRDTRHR